MLQTGAVAFFLNCHQLPLPSLSFIRSQANVPAGTPVVPPQVRI